MAAASPLLVIRFSALGDVAMTVPVLRIFLEQHPDRHICVVSNQDYAPLFEQIDRLTFIGADLKKRHRGIGGIFRLFSALRSAGPYAAVADLHHVLRSRLLGFLFACVGTPVVRLNKGRKEKRALTRRDHKNLLPLPTAFERMASVFEELQLPVVLPVTSFENSEHFAIRETAAMRGVVGLRKQGADGRCRIGIAPFARHPEKTYPVELLKEVVARLHRRQHISLIFFGGPGVEAQTLAAWENEFKGTRSMAGRHSLQEELKQLKELDMMVSMDSANMHLASLFNVPVLSIWGATHPYAGFMGWRQSSAWAVQLDLHCRPCSVFGNKKCYRGDHACMRQLSPSLIVERLDQLFASRIFDR